MATIGLLNAGGLGARDLDAGRAGIHAGNPEAREVVSSGFRPLDGLLSAGGIRRGSLVEWIGADEASGAATLAFAVACRLAGDVLAGGVPAGGVDAGLSGRRNGGLSGHRNGGLSGHRNGGLSGRRNGGAAASAAGTIIVVDRWGRFHPPAVMPWLEGVQLVVTRPSRDEDEAWAIDQSLRCPGVAAVLAWPKRIHSTAMRRWQLAARASSAVGLLVRPDAARREPSWAEARIAVSAVPGEQAAARRLRLTLAGGPWSGAAVEEERVVEIVLDLVRGCEGSAGRRRANLHERAGQLPADECLGAGPAARSPRLFQSAGRQPAGRQPGGRSCRAS